jgi:hypothetical protein
MQDVHMRDFALILRAATHLEQQQLLRLTYAHQSAIARLLRLLKSISSPLFLADLKLAIITYHRRRNHGSNRRLGATWWPAVSSKQ